MKKTLVMTIAAAAIILSGCQKSTGSGRLNLVLTEGEIAEVLTRGSVSDYASLPSEGDFTLTVKSGTTQVWTGLISEWDATTQLKVGNYSAEVSYGSAEDEGYSKPYFFGTADFAITGGQTTEVTVPVSLGNTIVKIECTDAFKNYYTTYSFTITTGAGTVIENVSDEVFMDAYKFTITGAFQTQGGAEQTMAAKSWNVDAATCYTVKFDVTNTGSVAITVSFDDTVQNVEFTEDLNA